MTNALFSQSDLQALIDKTSIAVSDASPKVLVVTNPELRVSNAIPKVLVVTKPELRVSKLSLFVILANYEVRMPSIYPTLIGLGYSVIKRPIWNTSNTAAASGRSSRASLQTYPIYEWDLTYDVLSDGAENFQSTTASDLKTLLGFFNSVAGGAFPFLFLDPDDNTVVAQPIGTADGVTAQFTFERTYGGTAGSSTEPVGYLNQAKTLNIYINGVLQAPSAYAITQANYYAQTVNFVTKPTSGAVITADFSFYYVVYFRDDKYDFEKFAFQLWSTKKITLRSDRA